MTEQEKLYNELRKMSKVVNQRILTLEKITGEKETFASKQLYDYLSSAELEGTLSEKGRVKVSKFYTISKMKAIIKAEKKFIEGVSTIRKLKKISEEYTKDLKKPLSLSQVNLLYQSGKDYKWIYDYIPKSEQGTGFWDVVKTANNNNWPLETFIEQISLLGNIEADEQTKIDLMALYVYVKD